MERVPHNGRYRQCHDNTRSGFVLVKVNCTNIQKEYILYLQYQRTRKLCPFVIHFVLICCGACHEHQRCGSVFRCGGRHLQSPETLCTLTNQRHMLLDASVVCLQRLFISNRHRLVTLTMFPNKQRFFVSCGK